MKIKLIVPVMVVFLTTYAQGQSFERKAFDGPGQDYLNRYHWADVNGDGAFDILEIGFYSKATLYISSGSDYMAKPLEFDDLYFEEGRHAFGDYDADGDMDLLATQGQKPVIVNYDPVNGFSLVNTGISFTDYGKIYWLDLDGDLILDIIYGRKIFLNRQGVYLESQILLPEYISNMVLDDVNGDGLTDILAAGYESYNGTDVSIFINEGDGHFKITAAPTLSATPLKSNSLALIDADGDSDVDVFAVDVNTRAWIFKNSLAQTGQMSFNGIQVASNIDLVRAVVGDVNSDGLADIVAVGRPSLIVFTNTSSGSAIEFAGESYDLQLNVLNNLDLIDINGDGKLDVHLKDYTMQNTWENLYFENKNPLTGTSPIAPVNLSSTVDKNVSLSWSALPGLLYNIEVKRDGVIYKSSGTSVSGKLLLTTGSFLCREGSLILRGLPAGTYEWRVQALDASGHSSAFSAINTFEISPGPSLTVQANDLKDVTLCWSYNSPGNPSFSIFRATSSQAAVEIAQVGAGITCYEDNAVPENQKVEYYVKAVTGSVYSAPSNIVTHHSTLFVETPFGMTDPNIIVGKCFPGDFDMDGDYDLEFIGRIGNWDNNFLLKNNGAGSFGSHGSMLPASSIVFPYTEMPGPRDIDNDGDLDMVVITGENYSRQRVSVFLNQNGAFTLGFESPEYLGIIQLAVEDFNNDGRADLLFSNTIGNSPGNPSQYQLLYQTANGGFEESHIILSNAETSTTSYFKCADINRDGFVDILWMVPDKKYQDILVNAEGMGFIKRTSILPATNSMGVADYNGDGNTDVIVLGNEGLNLYFGVGDFTFTEPKVIPVDYIPGSPEFITADIDLNGWPDLVIADGYSGQILFNTNGSLKRSGIKLRQSSGTTIAITDFENDGDIDLVKSGNDSQHQGLNYFYRNQLTDIYGVNQTPAAPVSVSATFEYGKAIFSWPAANDDKTPAKLLTYNLWIVDANGRVWLSPETNESGTFRKRMGPGNTGYSTSKTLNNLPAGVFTVRVQAIDASFALSPWSSPIQLTISEGPTALTIERILLNKVKLTWNGSPFAETNVVLKRRTVDTNWEVIAELPAGSDSYIDANLKYNTLYEYTVLETSGAVSTAQSDIVEWSTNMWVMQDTNIANLYGSMDVADFTGDGRMDIVLNGGMIYNGYYEDITRATFENTAGGWIKREVAPSSLTHTAQIAFADMNDDSKPDLYQHGYVWDSGYKTETFLNNGDKSFSPTTNIFTDGTYAIQSYFDFDMDNDLDISAVKAGSYPTVREVFKNNGGGNYSSVKTMVCNSCPQDVAVADFDQDGDEDVIRYTGGVYQLYLNTPDGQFGGMTFPGYQTKIAVTDYNSDGFPDVVVLSYTYQTDGRIYKNLGVQSNGSVQFAELPIKLSNGDQSMLSADFDHDGNTDMVVLSPNINVLLNNGDDTFQQYIEPRFRVSLHVAALIDFDNDGDLDIYFSGYHIKDYGDYGRKAKILLNQTIVSAKGASNTSPDAPTGLSSMQDANGVHVSWSKPHDDHTQPEGITYDVVLSRNGKDVTKGAHDPATGQRMRLVPGRSTGVATFNNLQVGSYSYRVQAIDGSFAGSDFSAEGTFIYLPGPPVMNDTLIYKCGRTVTLTAKGTDIKWYRDESLSQLIASDQFHPTETQTVYVTQTIDGNRGIPKRVQITILEKPPLPTFPFNNPYSICEGPGLQTLWATGGDVKWYSDELLNNLLSGTNEVQIPAANATYFVTQTIEGCSSPALAVQVKLTIIDSKLYYKDSKIWTKEKDGDYFYWYKNGTYYRYTTEPFIPFDGETATYMVFVSKGQCHEYSEPFSISEDVTGTEEIADTMIEMFPNPASSRVTLKSKSAHARINFSIFDSLGKRIYTASIDHQDEQTIDVSRWTRGVYTIVIDEDKNSFTKRLVLF